MLHALIMAGGTGTRFWPASRKAKPKQFLSLGGDETLLQETWRRCGNEIAPQNRWVVTNAQYAAETRAQLPELDADRMLLEPVGRNTAPCIGLAALCLLARDPEAVMVVLPADHIVQPPAAFARAVREAADFLSSAPQACVLFGAPPTYPATGFGYIEPAERAESAPDMHRVQSFREKPTLAVAAQFLADGRFLWNCGIFVWRAARILELIAEFEPGLASGLDRLKPAVGTPDFPRVLAAEFPQLPAKSIDYAVLERSPDTYVMRAPFAWDDVGSWEALARLRGQDEQGNTIVGKHCGLETRSCIIRSSDDHLIATVGLENCIVVHTPDVTFVARQGDEAALRRLIALLQERGDERFL